jgi:hypothetical protein
VAHLAIFAETNIDEKGQSSAGRPSLGEGPIMGSALVGFHLSLTFVG